MGCKPARNGGLIPSLRAVVLCWFVRCSERPEAR
jgi:hypothetical protein